MAKAPKKIVVEDVDIDEDTEGSEIVGEADDAAPTSEAPAPAPVPTHAIVRDDKVPLAELNRVAHRVFSENEVAKKRALDAATKALEAVFKKV